MGRFLALLTVVAAALSACSFVDDREATTSGDLPVPVAGGPATDAAPRTSGPSIPAASPSSTTAPTTSSVVPPEVEQLQELVAAADLQAEVCRRVRSMVTTTHDYVVSAATRTPEEHLAATRTLRSLVEQLRDVAPESYGEGLSSMTALVDQFISDQEGARDQTELIRAVSRFFRGIGPIVESSVRPIVEPCPPVPNGIWLEAAPDRWWELVAAGIDANN